MIGKLNYIVQKTKGKMVAPTTPNISNAGNVRVSNEGATRLDSMEISRGQR